MITTLASNQIKRTLIIVLIILFQVGSKNNEVYSFHKTEISTASCDICNGRIDLSLSGSGAIYKFLWNDGSTLENRTGLCKGIYTVTITDETGSFLKKEFEVETKEAMKLDGEVSDISCNGGNDGVINLSVINGSEPITYNWSDGQQTEDIFSAAPGTYTVTVTDGDKCSVKLNFEIKEANAFEINADLSHITCNSSTGGAIDLNVNGGTGPYTYQWSTGETSSSLDQLAAGSYYISVSDMHGCTAIAVFNINSEQPIEIDAIISEPGCNDLENGLIDIAVKNGKAPYQYIWSDGIITEDRNNLTNDEYIVTVTDADGCKMSSGFAINKKSNPMNLSFTSVSASCSDSWDGGADLNITGGVEPFTFLWNNGYTAEDILLVQGGNYSVTVTHGNGCSVSGSINISSPEALYARIESNNFDKKSSEVLSVLVSGGTVPYQYNWSTGESTAAIDNPAKGNCSVEVSDAAGCIYRVDYINAESASKPTAVKN